MSSELAPKLTSSERAMRDRFVSEYVVDYDPFAAALRIGYNKDFAEAYSRQFMCEPYVRQKIEEAKDAVGSQTDLDVHKTKILQMLYREAHAGKNKVAALNSLKEMLGLNPPVKQAVEVSTKAAVNFYIPNNGRS